MPSEPVLSTVLQDTTLESLRAARSHDAIVVGAGGAGGLAAALLAEAGLRVLVLDAGLPYARLRAPVRRVTGRLVGQLAKRSGFLPTALIPKAKKAIKLLGQWRQPVQSHCYAWELAPTAFVDDRDCPYVTAPDRPFIWVRSRMLGGRVAVPGHGRQYFRLNREDFAPRDGLSEAWPFQPDELDQWYASVERRLHLSGMRDEIPWFPDSEIANVRHPTLTEARLQDIIKEHWPGTRPILGRYAPPLDTLEAAARTGRLQCRQGAVVREIRVDSSGSVCGVVWIDHKTGSEQESSAPLVFLCASALESTRLLMLSRSSRGQQGLGATSGALGSYLMDHVYVGAWGFRKSQGVITLPEDGRCLYLPRFDARGSDTPDPGRGFGVQIHQFPAGNSQSYFIASSFAEMLPRQENRVTLDPKQRDAWGIPVLRIDCAYSEMELNQARDQTQALRELAQLAEVELTEIDETPRPPGSAFHECGTARMGTSPENSVLDADNQCWDARGLYVTDAACFPSQGCQNPTLTILALTARACNHALSSFDRELGSKTDGSKSQQGISYNLKL